MLLPVLTLSAQLAVLLALGLLGDTDWACAKPGCRAFTCKLTSAVVGKGPNLEARVTVHSRVGISSQALRRMLRATTLQELLLTALLFAFQIT